MGVSLKQPRKPKPRLNIVAELRSIYVQILDLETRILYLENSRGGYTSSSYEPPKVK